VIQLSSCFQTGCKKIDLSHEEKVWFDVFEKGDLFLYKKDDLTIDTFKVTGISLSYTVCNKFELSKYQYNEGGGRLKLLNSRSVYPKKVLVNFTKSLQYNGQERDPCLKYFTVFDLSSDCIKDLGGIPVDSIEVPGIPNRLLMTYRFDKDSSYMHDSNGGHTYLTSFNWSKEYGLIRYTTNKDEVFDFWKKI
jgi:hypothetical protein